MHCALGPKSHSGFDPSSLFHAALPDFKINKTDHPFYNIEGKALCQMTKHGGVFWSIDRGKLFFIHFASSAGVLVAEPNRVD